MDIALAPSLQRTAWDFPAILYLRKTSTTTRWKLIKTYIYVNIYLCIIYILYIFGCNGESIFSIHRPGRLWQTWPREALSWATLTDGGNQPWAIHTEKRYLHFIGRTCNRTIPFNFDLFVWNYLIVGQHDHWNFTRTQIGTDYNLLNSQIKGSFSADTWPVVLLLLSRHVIPADHLKWINMEKTTHIVRNDEINQRFAAQI